VLAAAIAALVLSVAFRYGAAERLWVEIARYLPYPLYLAPALVAVILSWRLERRWQWIAIAIVRLLLVIVAVGLLESGSGASGIPPTDSYCGPPGGGISSRLRSRDDPDAFVMQNAQRLHAGRVARGVPAAPGRQTFAMARHRRQPPSTADCHWTCRLRGEETFRDPCRDPCVDRAFTAYLPARRLARKRTATPSTTSP
jgi:hypothetical protein